WNNVNYIVEKAAYDEAISQYQEALTKWTVYEEERSKTISGSHKSIELQIERTERRLANLKAAKDGLPIPFPQG
ncbi:hypothetical protein, partial [Lactiplantibacillus plantarum]|uniref:hypothetical protein n=1 Tax=Lactiplantibacillus plantarum TaxID=1590 RepID=UPI003851FDD8